MIESLLKSLKTDKQLYLELKVRPGAPKTMLKEIDEEGKARIDIKSPAEKGKANKELIKFLAALFCVDKASVKIIFGAGSRKKLIKINR